MNCSSSPVAWLLILCDELQEWGREEFCVGKRGFVPVRSANILFDGNSMTVSYSAESKETVKKLNAKKEAIGDSIDLTNEFSLEIIASTNERRE